MKMNSNINNKRTFGDTTEQMQGPESMDAILSKKLFIDTTASSAKMMMPSDNSFDPSQYMGLQNTTTALRSGGNSSMEPGSSLPLFGPTFSKAKIVDVTGQSYQPVMNAKLEGGFFMNDNLWTCYRRNFIRAVTAFNYMTSTGGPQLMHSADQVLFVESSDGKQVPITGYRVNARGDTNINTDKRVQIVQYEVRHEKDPKPPKYRDIRCGGNLNDPSQIMRSPNALSAVSPGNALAAPVSHLPASAVAFDRLQFRSATSNNGKRRSIQQVFRLVLFLEAILSDGSIMEIASCASEDIVVRGRSPGHYADLEKIKANRRMSGGMKRASFSGPSSGNIWNRRPSDLPLNNMGFSATGPLTAPPISITPASSSLYGPSQSMMSAYPSAVDQQPPHRLPIYSNQTEPMQSFAMTALNHQQMDNALNQPLLPAILPSPLGETFALPISNSSTSSMLPAINTSSTITASNTTTSTNSLPSAHDMFSGQNGLMLKSPMALNDNNNGQPSNNGGMFFQSLSWQ